jgi:hypothetical protein
VAVLVVLLTGITRQVQLVMLVVTVVELLATQTVRVQVDDKVVPLHKLPKV